MKKFTHVFLLLTLAIILTACGSAKPNDNAKEAASPTTDAGTESITDKGVLLVGTEGMYAPFTFHDKDGKLTGYDVDVITEVAKRLDVKIEFVETQWDALFAGIDAKRFDVMANQISINDQRKAKYDFTDTYTKTNSVLVVNEDNTDIQKYSDMKGKKAAQTMTSNHADFAKKQGAELITVDGFIQEMELVASKRADGGFNDKLAVLDYLKQKKDLKVRVIDEGTDGFDIAFLLRKGEDAKIAEINKALEEMKADGTLKAISEKWFDDDVS